MVEAPVTVMRVAPDQSVVFGRSSESGLSKNRAVSIAAASDRGATLQTSNSGGRVVQSVESAPQPALTDLTVSRQFRKLDSREIPPFAGLAVVAFPRSPSGSLRARAELICEAFLRDLDDVETLDAAGTGRDRQVVTIWPLLLDEVAKVLERQSRDPAHADEVCQRAVTNYDRDAGWTALDDAAGFFRARDKPEIADRIAAPAQDGPWLLGWAPGDLKGKTSDDVLVLAFDLSHVTTAQEAERVFQAWRHAIERNPDLWRQERIANASWSAAIIRFANMIGRNLAFYRTMAE
jgi:hypothetical protein